VSDLCEAALGEERGLVMAETGKVTGEKDADE